MKEDEGVLYDFLEGDAFAGGEGVVCADDKGHGVVVEGDGFDAGVVKGEGDDGEFGAVHEEVFDEVARWGYLDGEGDLGVVVHVGFEDVGEEVGDGGIDGAKLESFAGEDVVAEQTV